MTRYVALIDGKKGAYGIAFPDLPGCTAMGDTIEAALAHAADSLRDWIEDAEEAGEMIPTPHALETLRRDPEVATALGEGAALASVPLIRETGRPAKANLSLDSGILRAIDEEAERRGLTRSNFVALLAKEALPKMG